MGGGFRHSGAYPRAEIIGEGKSPVNTFTWDGKPISPDEPTVRVLWRQKHRDLMTGNETVEEHIVVMPKRIFDTLRIGPGESYEEIQGPQ